MNFDGVYVAASFLVYNNVDSLKIISSHQLQDPRYRATLNPVQAAAAERWICDTLQLVGQNDLTDLIEEGEEEMAEEAEVTDPDDPDSKRLQMLVSLASSTTNTFSECIILT